MKKVITILFVFVISNICGFTQALPNLLLTRITEENGLSDNHVQCVYKDKNELVWIGTSEGLNLMNGSTIQIFKHNNSDSNSIVNNDINAIIEDKKGAIWIGTSFGICYFLPSTSKFYSIKMPASIYGASNLIRTINVDMDNHVWITTDGGLYRYNSESKILTPFFNLTKEESLSQINKYSATYIDHNGLLWLGTLDGIWMFDFKTNRFTRAFSKKEDNFYDGLITAIFVDAKNQMWFGNWSLGLKKIDLKAKKVIDYYKLPSSINHITAINEIETQNGQSFILLNGQLNCFIDNESRFAIFPSAFFKKEVPDITNFYKSKDGWIWMGSNQGLYIYNPHRQFFQHHFFENDITTQSVNFAEDNKQILVGAQGKNFLKSYDEHWNVKRDYSKVLQSLQSKDILECAALCIAKKSDNTLLIGTSAGILQYNVQNDNSRWYCDNNRNLNSIPRNFIQHLFIDAEKQWWIFPWRQGIYTMDSATGNCKLMCKGFLQEEKEIKGLLIASTAEDLQGNLWMADPDEGIILYDRKENSFSKPFEKELGARARSGKIYSANGFCYSYVNATLLKWNTTTKKLHQFSLPLQMQGDILDFCLDKNYNWWIATQKGLIELDSGCHIFKKFSTSDGLIENDLSATLYLRNNGEIIIAKPAYITQFNPTDLLADSPSSAKILISNIEVNGKHIEYDSSKTLMLNYRTNNLIFHWTMTDYLNPFNNQYYCMLKGIDKDWKYVGNKGEIQYANLSFGNYTLLLKAATANGILSDKMIRIHFEITPPLWKRTWFWLLSVAGVATFIFWLVHKRIESIHAKSALKQQMAELEMKALRAQMNPHFIFNSLSSIQESIVHHKSEAASKYLGKFSKLIRMVLENSGKKYISLDDEMEYLQLYLELESFRFDDLKFEIICRIEDTAFIKIPPMIVQPFIENAIKHGLSHKQGEKKLSVRFYFTNTEKLITEVHDNGIGRKQSMQINQSRVGAHQSMGMQITQQRLSLLHERNDFSIEILDEVDDNNNPQGTTIKITLPTEK